jgi:CRISPR/Cas system endoribonuclease Cas6 (RAMP superfamily)
LNEKIDYFQQAIDELSESVLNETKSTAGDKHETALSILQSEQSRLAVHLYDAHDQKSFYCQIILEEMYNIIKVGSLVKTSKGWFYISVALPKIVIEEKSIIAISSKSPLGEKLFGKKRNEQIEINGIVHIVEEIL